MRRLKKGHQKGWGSSCPKKNQDLPLTFSWYSVPILPAWLHH
jgi:hypothetical protein